MAFAWNLVAMMSTGVVLVDLCTARCSIEAPSVGPQFKS